jgi:hypothetical protein
MTASIVLRKFADNVGQGFASQPRQGSEKDFIY